MDLSSFKLIDNSSQKDLYEQLVTGFNNTETDYPRDSSLPELFESMATRYPEKVAIVYEQTEITYSALNHRASEIASFLSARGIRTEEVIGVVFENEILSITTLLGILKAGGAYAFISPENPFERNRFIIQDLNLRFIISERKYIKAIQNFLWSTNLSEFICLDSEDVIREIDDTSELMRRDLWDFVGEQAENDIAAGGWINSYTGEELSRAVMDEYADNIKSKLMPYLTPDKNVLEVGCSSGISMFRIAPFVKHYCGTDLSATILEFTRKQAETFNHQNVATYCFAAHETHQLNESGFDIAIMNSVIQCFSGYNYFIDVLRQLIRKLNDHSIIFLGDIMDLERKDDLIRSLQEFKQHDSGSQYKTKIDWSNELFFHQDFFNELPYYFPEIEAVTITSKLGEIGGELRDFRYDVILRIYKGWNKKNNQAAIKKTWCKTDIDGINLVASAKPAPANAAYVVYTSGSTGRPKGVIIEQRSIVRLVRNTSYISLGVDNNCLKSSTTAFDASTFEIWGALLNGATLHAISRTVLLDSFQLDKFLKENRIDTCWMTASLFNTHLDLNPTIFSSLKTILVGGEALSIRHINLLHSLYPELTIVNGYGPTENTTFSTYHIIDRTYTENVPIGKPVSNSQAYILNAYFNIVPIGIVGELYVSGDGLARGYVNNPELTLEKFVDHPFLPGKKLYKTGDLAKRLPDGEIEFIGRKDNQVKIRGHRIEIDEIDHTIKNIPGVEDSTVQVYREEKSGDAKIYAFLKCAAGYTEENIRTEAAKFLPEYMMPESFFILDSLPLTENGKLDRSALSVAEHLHSERSAVIYTDNVEETLLKIWKELLPGKLILANQNFFTLGGHSLLATRMLSRIQKDMKADISLKDIFLNPTIVQLAAFIRKAKSTAHIAISPAGKKAFYETSYAQNRLWVLNQLTVGQKAYNIPFAYAIEGNFSPALLEQAMQRVVARHESLRTVFINIDGSPKQHIIENDQFRFRLPLIDLTSNPDRHSILNESIGIDSKQIFDLQKGPLLFAKLYHVEETKWVLFGNFHHIVADGWSLGVFFNECQQIYNHLQYGAPLTLPELRVQYKDYAEWQHQNFIGDWWISQKEYWKNKLSGTLPVLDIRTDCPRSSERSYHGKKIQVKIDENLRAKLVKFSESHGLTLYMTLLTGLNVLLSRYANQRDIIIGTSIAGRDHYDLEGQIGFFVNTLVLRTIIGDDMTFGDLASATKQNVLEAFEHQYYPFDKLVHDVGANRIPGRSPIFDVMAEFLNFKTPSDQSIALMGSSVTTYSTGYSVSKYDLTFRFIENEHLSLIVEYSTDLFAKETIEMLSAHLMNIFDQVNALADSPVRAIEFLSNTQKRELLGMPPDVQQDKSHQGIISLIEGQAIRNPEQLAVVSNGVSYSYKTLSMDSDRLALHMATVCKVAKGDYVIVALPGSYDLFVSFLAILKAGAIIVPVDCELPAMRKKYMLDDTQAKLVITTSNYLNEFSELNCQSIFATDLQLETLPYCESVSEQISDDDAAYVIYTSGTTGRPKGVVVPHSSLLNYIHAAEDLYVKGKRNIRFGFFTSPAFDLTLTSIFVPLTCGGAIIKAGGDHVISQLTSLLSDENAVNFMKMTPSHLSALKYSEIKAKALECVILGGEALTEDHINIISELNPSTKIYNEYGPTEGTIGCIVHEVKKGQPVIIGVPIKNTFACILNSDLQLQPPGVVGELYIGGNCLAHGYLNNPEATFSKFGQVKINGLNLYKTGDQGLRTTSGEFIYLGRTDTQIKLRGFRIELEELESYLCKVEGIDQAAVVLMDTTANGEFLVCFFTAGPLFKTEIENIRSYFESFVPVYMIPEEFIRVDEMPLTINGKIDRSILKKNFSVEQPSQQRFIPVTHADKILSGVWEDIVTASVINAGDDFFLAGGNSLLAIQLINKVNSILGTDVRLDEFFDNSTFEKFAEILNGRETNFHIPTVSPISIKEDSCYDLSAGQLALWYSYKLNPLSIEYNVPMSKRMSGIELDTDILRTALLELVKRHEVLRTTFVEINGKPWQKIHAASIDCFSFEFSDLSKEVSPQAFFKKRVEEIIQTPFELDKFPLLRTHVFKLSPQSFIFVVTTHHIICDEWSRDLIFSDLEKIYQSIQTNDLSSLPELKIHYKDYAAWNRIHIDSNVSELKQYWLKQFEGNIPTLNFSFAKPRVSPRSTAGKSLQVVFELKETSLMKSVIERNETTPFIFLVTVLKSLIYRYTGQQDIIIGTPISNRTQTVLEDQLGYYLNILPIRTLIRDEMTFKQFLKAVDTQVKGAIRHREYPFLGMVQDLSLKRDLSRSPLFDILLIFRDKKDTEYKSTDSEYQLAFNESKYDMTFDLMLFDGKLQIMINYSTSLFEEESIRELIEDFCMLIDQTSDNEEKPVHEVIFSSFDKKAKPSSFENLNFSFED